MPKLVILIPTILLLIYPLMAQVSQKSAGSGPDIRTVSVYTGIGFLEYLVLGAQYQINDKFSFGVKADAIFLGGGSGLPNAGIGGGIKASYFFDRDWYDNFLGFNTVNLEASYLGIRSGPNEFGTGLELTVGHDSIEGCGLGLLWALGAAYSVSTDHPALLFPALKLGIHLDL